MRASPLPLALSLSISTAIILNAWVLTRISSGSNGRQLALPFFLSCYCTVLYCTSICHVGHPRERVRRGPAGEGCPVAEGRSAVRHSHSAVSSWIGLNSVSHRSLASPVGAVSPLPSPSGVLLYRWLHRPCCPSQPPQRPFPVSDAVHLLISLLPETPSVYRFAQFQVSSSIVSVVYVLYRHTVDLISLPGFAV